MAKPDGGPVFPNGHPRVKQIGAATLAIGGRDQDPTWEFDGGMTLRDYFAGQALAGRCGFAVGDDVPADSLAREAYAIADAMLAEREK